MYGYDRLGLASPSKYVSLLCQQEKAARSILQTQLIEYWENISQLKEAER